MEKKTKSQHAKSLHPPSLSLEKKNQLAKLSKKLGYEFEDITRLLAALTHRSKHVLNNERLEFLGDAVLGYVVSSELYQRFPEATEGQLSRGRASLVKGETLATLARDMALGEFLQLGPGELKSGGFRRDSILADTVEAIIGAIYLDGGLLSVKSYILTLFATKLEHLSLDEIDKDPKTQLQEYLQARRQALPNYSVISMSGSDHEQVFEVSCNVAGLATPAQGNGSSRRKAEQAAAEKALKRLLE
ncbi:MAG: ribonuclease III [Gammaproteobacteria bacterium]|nr:ribonuclease III [Gammaproteobacteria bacterium]